MVSSKRLEPLLPQTAAPRKLLEGMRFHPPLCWTRLWHNTFGLVLEVTVSSPKGFGKKDHCAHFRCTNPRRTGRHSRGLRFSTLWRSWTSPAARAPQSTSAASSSPASAVPPAPTSPDRSYAAAPGRPPSIPARFRLDCLHPVGHTPASSKEQMPTSFPLQVQ